VFQKLVKLGRDFGQKNMLKNLHAQIIEKYAKAQISLKKCWSSYPRYLHILGTS
jgi:hypothetical protein